MWSAQMQWKTLLPSNQWEGCKCGNCVHLLQFSHLSPLFVTLIHSTKHEETQEDEQIESPISQSHHHHPLLVLLQLRFRFVKLVIKCGKDFLEHGPSFSLCVCVSLCCHIKPNTGPTDQSDWNLSLVGVALVWYPTPLVRFRWKNEVLTPIRLEVRRCLPTEGVVYSPKISISKITGTL
jgi:hypothetical protein